MTWPELLQSDKLVLTPDDVAPILGCNPSAIREQAQRDARLLGFPVTITGSRVRIPRQALFWFVQYGYPMPVNAAFPIQPQGTDLRFYAG